MCRALCEKRWIKRCMWYQMSSHLSRSEALSQVSQLLFKILSYNNPMVFYFSLHVPVRWRVAYFAIHFFTPGIIERLVQYFSIQKVIDHF